MTKLENSLAILRKRLSGERPLFPEEVIFVKTSGLEEGGAAYCRGHNVICLPEQELKKSEEGLARTICHELFHILTRNSELLRRELYEAIGFRRSKPLTLPSDISKMKITNPDAHLQDSLFTARLKDGTTATVIPVLLASRPYDFSTKLDFFEYLTLVFFSVELSAEGTPTIRLQNGRYTAFALDDLQNFYEKVGRNTSYVIDPEEILADNFVLSLWGEPNVESPEIIAAMRRILEI